MVTLPRILYVEPFAGGSHESFGRVLTRAVPAQWTVLTLPARHWKWRMRGSAAYFALDREDALAGPFDGVFASSYTPLAELVALAPALQRVPRLLYFHENQLAFPIAGAPDERDLHFGFTQLVSALAADRCAFNSAFNRDSFLAAAAELLARMPDAVPRGWVERVRARSMVLPVPIDLPDEPPAVRAPVDRSRGPLLVWNHRWEHDKDPASFFAALRELVELDVRFRVAVCGERFASEPPVFEAARAWLGDRIEQWGPLPRADYLALLGSADLAISTALQEFFGVSMLEATHLGARPLVPDRLAYRELYPAALRWRDHAELVRLLAELCRAFVAGVELRADRRDITRPFLTDAVAPRYAETLRRLASGQT
jgi:glycosyltransferase involved in cell wall biosynthesis